MLQVSDGCAGTSSFFRVSSPQSLSSATSQAVPMSRIGAFPTDEAFPSLLVLEAKSLLLLSAVPATNRRLFFNPPSLVFTATAFPCLRWSLGIAPAFSLDFDGTLLSRTIPSSVASPPLCVISSGGRQKEIVSYSAPSNSVCNVPSSTCPARARTLWKIFCSPSTLRIGRHSSSLIHSSLTHLNLLLSLYSRCLEILCIKHPIR